MGTNYYYNQSSSCEKCGSVLEQERRHIGKSSVGWCFSLHVYPEEGINTLDDWINHIHSNVGYINDEYGDLISFNQLISTITNRKASGYDLEFSEEAQAAWWEQREKNYRSLKREFSYKSQYLYKGYPFTTSPDDDYRNCLIPPRGPHGLWRHDIGDHCVGHGEGTYDYIIGDFS